MIEADGAFKLVGACAGKERSRDGRYRETYASIYRLYFNMHRNLLEPIHTKHTHTHTQTH